MDYEYYLSKVIQKLCGTRYKIQLLGHERQAPWSLSYFPDIFSKVLNINSYTVEKKKITININDGKMAKREVIYW